MRINATGAGHQSRMHHPCQRNALLAARRSRKAVTGQTPTGVEGHSETVHRLAPKQSLKAHLGGHHVHRLGLFEERSGVKPIGADLDAGVLQIPTAEMAACPAANHVRMHLHHHGAIRMIPQGSLQHLLKLLLTSLSEGD